MDREPERTLDYFRGRTSPRVTLPSADVFLSTAVFAVSHMVAEYYTGSFVAFKLGLFGATTTPYEMALVEHHFIFNMLTEAVWVIMAAVVVFMIQWLFQPPNSKHRPSRVSIAAVFGGVFYCWMGWGIWCISQRLGFSIREFTNYLVSMAIAALVGIGLAMLRRKLSQPTDARPAQAALV